MVKSIGKSQAGKPLTIRPLASAAIRAPQDLPITTAFGLKRVGGQANIDIFICALHPTKHIKIIYIYIYVYTVYINAPIETLVQIGSVHLGFPIVGITVNMRGLNELD